MNDTSHKDLTGDAEEGEPLGFIAHLLELRDRLLRVIVVVGAVFLVLFPLANSLYSLLAEPLLAHMPVGSNMIAVEVISPFLTPLKLSLYAALIIGMPYLLYQAWAFVAPGLYAHEKRLAMPLLVSSVFLFYAGVAFAYFVVFPLVFNFLISVAPEGVAVMTDISKYLDFVLALFLAFGLAFEVPVATIIMIATGMTDAESLTEKRPYIIVGAFVVGMLLTPPDVISQIMLALPMWLLFELGIIMSKVLIKPVDTEELGDRPRKHAPANTAQQTATAAASAAGSAGTNASTNTGTAGHDHTPAPPDPDTYPSDYQPLTDEQADEELDVMADWDDSDADDWDEGWEDENEGEDEGDDKEDQPGSAAP